MTFPTPTEENKEWEDQTFRELVRTVLDGRTGDIEELLNRIIADCRNRTLEEAVKRLEGMKFGDDNQTERIISFGPIYGR